MRMRVGTVLMVEVNGSGIHVSACRISKRRGGFMGVRVGTVYMGCLVGRMVSTTTNIANEQQDQGEDCADGLKQAGFHNVFAVC